MTGTERDRAVLEELIRAAFPEAAGPGADFEPDAEPDAEPDSEPDSDQETGIQ